jgi:hypothetical protein
LYHPTEKRSNEIIEDLGRSAIILETALIHISENPFLSNIHERTGHFKWLVYPPFEN